MAYKFRGYICLKALDPKRSYNEHNNIQVLICSYSMAKHTHACTHSCMHTHTHAHTHTHTPSMLMADTHCAANTTQPACVSSSSAARGSTPSHSATKLGKRGKGIAEGGQTTAYN